MTTLLIVSDNVNVSNTFKQGFSRENWLIDHIKLSSLVESSNISTVDYKFIVLAITPSFITHFSSILDDLRKKLRAPSQKTSLYLVFEGEYDAVFNPWLLYIKRLFTMAIQPHKFQHALDEIIKLESAGMTRINYSSPMDAF